MPGWSCDPHPGSIEENEGSCVSSAGGVGESGFVVSPDILFGPRGGRKGKTADDNVEGEDAHVAAVAATLSPPEEAWQDESAGGDSRGSVAGFGDGAEPTALPLARRSKDARQDRIKSVPANGANGRGESERRWTPIVNGGLTGTEEKRNAEVVVGRSEKLDSGGQRGAMDDGGWKDRSSSMEPAITAGDKTEFGSQAVALSNGSGGSTADVEESSVVQQQQQPGETTATADGTSGCRAALDAVTAAESGDLDGRTIGLRLGSAERSLSSSSSTSSASSGVAVDADGARKGGGTATAGRARKGGGPGGVGGGGRMGNKQLSPIMGGANGVLPGGGRGPPLMMGPGMGPPPPMYPMVPDFVGGGMMGMYGPPPSLPPPPGGGPGGLMGPMVANHHHHHHPYMMQQPSPRSGMGPMGGAGMLGGRLPPPQLPPPPGAFVPPVLGPPGALGQHTLRYPFGQIIGCTEGTLTMYQRMPSFLLPSSMLLATSQILPGACALFVFNVDTQQIHGYFRSTSHGWEQRLMQTYDGLVPTPMLAANIAFEVVEDFAQPLVRADYQPVFGPSWVDRWQLPMFLSPIQVEQLLLLFEAKKAHASAEHPAAAPPLQSGPQTSQPLPPSALPASSSGAAAKGGDTNGQGPADLPGHGLALGNGTPPVSTTNGGQNAAAAGLERDERNKVLDDDEKSPLAAPEASTAEATSEAAIEAHPAASSPPSAPAMPPGDGATSASGLDAATEQKSAPIESEAPPPPSAPPMASDVAKVVDESKKSPQQQGTPASSPGAGVSANGIALSGPSTPRAPPSPTGRAVGRGRGAAAPTFAPMVLTPPRKKAGGSPMAFAAATGAETAGGGGVAGAEVSRPVSRALLPESPPFFPKQPPTTLPEGESGETTKKASDAIAPPKKSPFPNKPSATNLSFPVVELPDLFSGATTVPITFGAFTSQERSSGDRGPDVPDLVQITFGSFPPVTANATAPHGDDVAEKKRNEGVESPATNAKGVEVKAFSVEMSHLFPLLFPKVLDPANEKPNNTTTTDWSALPTNQDTKANKAPPPTTPAPLESPSSSPSCQIAPTDADAPPPIGAGTHPPPLSTAKTLPPSKTAFSAASSPQFSVPQARPPPPRGGAAVAFVTPPRGPHRGPLHHPSTADRFLRPSPSPHPQIFSIPPPGPPTAYALTPRASPLPLSRSLSPHTLSPSAPQPPLQSPSSPFPLPPTRHALLPPSAQAGAPPGTYVGMTAGVLTVPVSPTASLASTAESTASSVEPEQCLFCFERRADYFFLTCKHWGPCVDCHKSGNIVMCRQPQCGLPVTKESLHRVFR